MREFKTIIPKINGEWRQEEAKLKLGKNCKLQSAFAAFAVKAFAERLGISFEQEANLCMDITKDDSLGVEEFAVHIKDSGIYISAATEQGVIYALNTVSKLIDEDGYIYCGYIADKPKYSYRGVLLDCVRHFFPMVELYKIIEEMSLLGLNAMHWVLSNDQGYCLESKAFPALHQQMGDRYYSIKEVKEFLEYAKCRGITIIPEIDFPGHVTAILAAYPNLSCFEKQVEVANQPGIYPIVLCTGKEEVYDFVDTLVDEVAEIFTGEYFHIGGDEVPDWEWKKCPHCQARMKEEGFTESRQLQGYFSKRVLESFKKKSKKVIFWNDALLAAGNVFEKDRKEEKALIQYWTVQFADSMLSYIKEGGRFIYSDMFELYFDYPVSMTPLQRVYEVRANIKGEVFDTTNSAIMGTEACLWTEHVHTSEELEQKLFPRIVAAAENAWSMDLDYMDFTIRLELYIAALAKKNIQSGSLREPVGQEKEEMTRAYLNQMKTSVSEEVFQMTQEYVDPNQDYEERYNKLFLGQ